MMRIGKLEGDLDKRTDTLAIYDGFIGKAVLLDEDREKLKKDRGFSDDVIDACRFKSARPENADIIREMQANIGDDEPLLATGLLYRRKNEDGSFKDEPPIPSIQLTERNIIIPYLNENKEAYFIRPHKFGLEGVPIQIYAPFRPLDGTIVIAESEFKAVASCMLGVKAIGIPGISSFAGSHLPRLVDFLSKTDVKKIIILFDNEIKNNPKFPNYKEDVLKQWDTQWRAIQMAKMLYKELKLAVSVLVGELPSEWMVNGKIDIDGALAQGRTSEQYQQVISSAMLPDRYLETLPPIAQRIIKKKILRIQMKSPIVRKVEGMDVGYYALEQVNKKGEEPYTLEREITDFVMEIRKTVEEGQAPRLREILIYGRDGTVSGPHWFSSDDFDLRDFRKWAFGHGNFFFKGDGDDLNDIFRLETSEADIRIIKRFNHIGLLKGEEPPVWLFGNCLIKSDGATLLPDDNGVMWDGLDGYQPRSIREVDGGEDNSTAKMPMINLDKDVKFGLPELKNVAEKLCQNFDNEIIKLAVGWSVASLFSDEIFKRYACFPILFIGGKRESGKTTLGNWLMAMHGFSDASGDPLSSTTRPGVARNLSWFRNIAYWLDEYRNNKKIKEWDGYFRNVYQRQASSKGTLGSSIRSDDVNACLMLSGEETPEDNAFLSRCIIINLVKQTQRKNDVFKEIETLRHKGLLSRLIIEVLSRKEKLLPHILEDIGLLKDRLLKNQVGERIALNYAIAGASFMRVFLESEGVDKIGKFVEWLIREAKRMDEEKDKEHMINQFFDDLPTLAEDLKDFYSVFEDKNAAKGKRKIAFHFRSFYSKWVEAFRRKGNEQFKAQTMLSYILEEPYYIAHDTPRKIGPLGKSTRCLILSLDAEHNPPPGLLTIADGVSAAQDSPDGANAAPAAASDLF